MSLDPNWIDINKCRIWKVLGVTECDNCPTRLKCWGKNSDLPEPVENTISSKEGI